MKSESDTLSERMEANEAEKCCLLKTKYPEITLDSIKMVLYGKKTNDLFKINEACYDEQLIKIHSIPKELLVTMPKELKLRPTSIPTADDTLGVFSCCPIGVGTEMGPYVGRVRRLSEVTRDDRWAWEVFNEKDGDVNFLVDAAPPQFHGWIAYVQCARHEAEQNLEIVQIGPNLYYRVIKTIAPNEELLVWYSSKFPTYLGLPVTPNLFNYPNADEIRPLISCTSGNRLRCVVCKRGFNSRSNLRSHMRIHTMEKPFVCKFCQRSFSQSSTLRNHVRLHTGEKPYKCHVCNSAYSQLAGLRAHQKSSRHRPVISEPGPKSPKATSLEIADIQLTKFPDKNASVEVLTSQSEILSRH